MHFSLASAPKAFVVQWTGEKVWLRAAPFYSGSSLFKSQIRKKPGCRAVGPGVLEGAIVPPIPPDFSRNRNKTFSFQRPRISTPHNHIQIFWLSYVPVMCKSTQSSMKKNCIQPENSYGCNFKKFSVIKTDWKWMPLFKWQSWINFSPPALSFPFQIPDLDSKLK